MNKLPLFLSLFVIVYLFFQFGICVEYGNNKAAGKYYNVRGFKMYCEIYGKGKPLLMIHGNGGSISTFTNNIPYFAQRYKVIVTDSRAQGKSTDTSTDSLSFKMMADDEAELLHQMHIDSAYVLGWSDGGVVALIMAIRHPEKVIKFAASGANITSDSNAVGQKTWLEQKEKFESSKKKVFVNEKEKNDWKIFLLDWLYPNLTLNEVHQIKCPAFIIAGDHDMIPLKHTKKIHQNIAGSKMWIIPNSGHPTLVEHKDEFNSRIDDFFQKADHR